MEWNIILVGYINIVEQQLHYFWLLCVAINSIGFIIAGDYIAHTHFYFLQHQVLLSCQGREMAWHGMGWVGGSILKCQVKFSLPILTNKAPD